MHLEYTDEQQQLRVKMRAQLNAVMTPERIEAVAGRMEGGPAIKECVQASFNRVDDVDHVLVTSGTGVPTSALISGRP